MTATATFIEELAVVEFLRDLDRFPRGTIGTVVAAHPGRDLYLVEVTDPRGTTLGLVDAHGADLRLVSV